MSDHSRTTADDEQPFDLQSFLDDFVSSLEPREHAEVDLPGGDPHRS